MSASLSALIGALDDAALICALDDAAMAALAERLMPFLRERLADSSTSPGAIGGDEVLQVASTAALVAIDPDPLLTPREAAAQLSFTPGYVLRLGREGRLPRVKPPGVKYVRFPLSGVVGFRESGRPAPAPAARARVSPADMKSGATKQGSRRKRF